MDTQCLVLKVVSPTPVKPLDPVSLSWPPTPSLTKQLEMWLSALAPTSAILQQLAFLLGKLQ